MGIEIERKFLVSGDGWRQGAEGKFYRQGYLCLDPDRTVRVRIAGDEGFLTIKGRTEGMTRNEFEYPILCAEASQMLEYLCCRPLIEKIRYTLVYKGRIWEIDEFGGENQGLILAEVELESESDQVELPPWIGAEVTGDPRYYNANLSQNPYRQWPQP